VSKGLWDEPNKPIFDPDFWHRRLLWAAATGRGTFTAIYDTEQETWNRIQENTKSELVKLLKPGDRLLDAGCGYGAATECLPDGVTYVGVDCSWDMVDVARMRYPDREFLTADMRGLPFASSAFRWALCRSLRKMVVDNVGRPTWDTIQAELLRVADSLILLEYEDWCSSVEVIHGGV
jgi:SAM-dependent methyltransferase